MQDPHVYAWTRVVGGGLTAMYVAPIDADVWSVEGVKASFFWCAARRGS